MSTVVLDPRRYARFLRHMMGVVEPRRTVDEMRWDDDGGSPTPEPVRYTHTFKAA